MKKKSFLLIALVFNVGFAFSSHFSKNWTGFGFSHMNFNVNSALVNGEPLQAGDEIAVFDGVNCVGFKEVVDPTLSGNFVFIIASADDPTTLPLDGYRTNFPATIKIWDQSRGVEITDVAILNPVGPQDFTPGATLWMDLTGTAPISAPMAYVVTGGGWHCLSSDEYDGLPIGLEDSQVGVTYTLYKDNVAQAPTVSGTGTAITFENHLAGTYTVKGSNSGGTTDMTGIALIIDSSTNPVSVSLEASGNPVCEGTLVTFTPKPVNGGSSVYNWYVNGEIKDGGFGPWDYTPVNGDIIQVELISTLPCTVGNHAKSDPITMVVNPIVTPSASIAITSGSNPSCSGSNVVFTATPINGGTPTYQWKKGSANVGINSDTYTDDGTTAGSISVVMTSTLSCVTSPTATSNVIDLTITSKLSPSVSIVITSGSNPSCSGSDVVFTATPTNGGTPSYQWYKGTNPVGTNSDTYTDNGTTAGSISVVMTSTLSCVTSPIATSNAIDLTINSTGQWLGTTSSDWDDPSNWCGGVPTSSTNVTIPAGIIQPVVGVSSSASCNDINIDEGATLTIASNETGTGSLIVSGSVSGVGKVIAQRYMKTDKWNYVSSPVSGQSIHNFLLANDNIALDENTVSGQEHADNTIRGMMDYDPANNVWNDYFTNSTVGNLGGGKGFCMRTTTDGAVSFTGNIQTGPISATASSGYWNCIGNPYTSAIGINDGSGNGANFLFENRDNLDLSYGAIYVWDKADEFNGGDNYAVYSNASTPYDFQQGQAFMIKMKSSASQVIFKSEMQVHDPGLELKSTKNVWPTIKLAATFNAQKSSTIIAFNNGMTKGLDPTYDAGLLKAGSDLSVYSRLVEDNGIPFAIQALPLSDLSGTIIPIGLDFKTGGKVAFSAELLNLPSDGQVILEDKLSKTFTDLSKEIYKTDISANTSVYDRFQIHVSSLTTGVKIDTNSDPLNAFAISKNEILIKGQVSNQAVATLYDIQGRAILIKNLEEGSLNIIQTPNIRTGIYMLSVKDNGKVQGFKIPVRE